MNQKSLPTINIDNPNVIKIVFKTTEENQQVKYGYFGQYVVNNIKVDGDSSVVGGTDGSSPYVTVPTPGVHIFEANLTNGSDSNYTFRLQNVEFISVQIPLDVYGIGRLNDCSFYPSVASVYTIDALDAKATYLGISSAQCLPYQIRVPKGTKQLYEQGGKYNYVLDRMIEVNFKY